MKQLYLLLVSVILNCTAFAQQSSIIIGDSVNVTFYKRLQPFDTVRQIKAGYADTSFIDINNDDIHDFILLSKGNLEGMMGGALEYITIIPLDSNAVFYDRLDTSTCFGIEVRPIASEFMMGDTLSDLNQNIHTETFLNYISWSMGWPCGVSFGNYADKYIGVKLNRGPAKGLGWIRLETINGGFSYGPYGVIKELAFTAGLNSTPEVHRKRVSAAPNPSNGKFRVSLPGSSFPIRMIVYNSMCQKVSENEYPQEFIELSLPKGLYFCVIFCDDRELDTLTVLIE